MNKYSFSLRNDKSALSDVIKAKNFDEALRTILEIGKSRGFTKVNIEWLICLDNNYTYIYNFKFVWKPSEQLQSL